MMSSSLPHVTSNHVSYNGLYGVAVFSQKEGARELPGAQENFSEDGDAALWEPELEKDEDPLRQPVTVALVESNSVNHNGGESPRPPPRSTAVEVSPPQWPFQPSGLSDRFLCPLTRYPSPRT